MISTQKLHAGLPLALAALCLVAGCAVQRPVLYPNAKLQQAGPEVAERDIDECIALAQQTLGSGERMAEAGRSSATGAAVGAAGGAAAGAVRGHAGRGAATGAAGGAAAGLTRGLIKAHQLDPVTRRWVEACLQERGYRTIGWK